MEQIINDNPRYKLLSKAKLVKTIRDKYDISVKDINDWYDKRELSQVYKPTKTKAANKLKITAEPFSFQVDIVKLPGYKRYNGNVEQFLLLVDITSRKAFAYPLKTGKMEDVLDKYEQFMKDVGEDVKSIAGDDFFNNEEFLKYNEELGVEVHTDVAKDDHLTPLGNKLGIIDRLVKTLKINIQKYMLEFKSMKWTEFLDEVLESYNDSPHSGLKSGLSPNEVFDDPDYAEKVHINLAKKNKKEFESYDFDIGDKVRTQLGKGTFEKEKQKYSSEIYEIKEQEGYRFVLQTDKGTEVKRRYRPTELLKVESVTDRIDDKQMTTAQAEEKQVRKVVSDTGISHELAQMILDENRNDRTVFSDNSKRKYQSTGKRNLRSRK